MEFVSGGCWVGERLQGANVEASRRLVRRVATTLALKS